MAWLVGDCDNDGDSVGMDAIKQAQHKIKRVRKSQQAPDMGTERLTMRIPFDRDTHSKATWILKSDCNSGWRGSMAILVSAM